ncbi:ABC transporter substrate-binding protein [Geomesophilobacter sediminis]|uniref:ABC transporter substrate-binding protein n=1 Tax=Geomesophilobacter sediminis TaxID=2798584 RepID=A0A8J7M0U5_9BACT|nr:ABC transporter substrate-binding protein [Geomesophilobacter sediminis]MBJ6726542.1 ABC transporter substrate-binding protein [Geomesophilobacter sediminis]
MKRFFLLVSIVVFGATALHAEPTGNVIKIGMVNDQTGPTKGSGRGIKIGVDAYFKAVNEKGGVNGKKLELLVVNDMYQPEKTVDGLLKLIEQQKIFAVVGTVGTSSGVSIIPVVKEYKLPFVAPRSGAADFRTPVTRELFNIRASHQEEVDKLVDLLVAAGAKRFAFFYQNDTFGLDVLNCTEKALKRHGLSIIAKGSHERGTEAVTTGLASIMAAGAPDAIVMGSSYAPVAEFVKGVRKEGLKVYLATGSFASGANMVKAAGNAAEGVIMSQVVPHLQDLSLPLTKECKEAIDKNPEEMGFNAVTMEGCMAAKSMVMALEKAGDPPTQEGFIQGLRVDEGCRHGGDQTDLHPGKPPGAE